MTLVEREALQKKLSDAANAADAADKTCNDLKVARAKCDDESKHAEMDTQIATADTICKERHEAVLALKPVIEAAVAEAQKQKERQSVLDLISGVSIQGAPAPQEPILVQTQTAQVKDWDAYGKAQMETVRDFLQAGCSKSVAGFDQAKRDMINGNSYDYVGSDSSPRLEKRIQPDGVAVLPKWFSRTIMDAQFQSKVIYSIDDAVHNPSMANNLVPEEYKATLLQLPMPPATVLPWVTRIPTNTGELTWPRLVQTDTNEFGGIVMRWITQLQEKPETEPRFAIDRIPCHELAGFTALHHKILIRSAISLEPLLASLYRAAIAIELENVIINGTGDATGQPMGVLNAVGVRTQARATAGQVGWEDCKHLKHKLQFYHKNGARYVLGDDVEEELEDELDGQSRPLFSATTASGPYDRIVGYPYHVSYNSPALGNAADVIFAVWKYYFLVVEEDVMIAKSDHFRFQENLRSIKVFMNVGGRPIQPRAFAYLEGVSAS